MKVVINNCFGGFSLSPLAIKRLAELQGKDCYFFIQKFSDGQSSNYIPATIDEAKDAFLFWAFSTPKPNEVLRDEKEWHDMTSEEKRAHNELYDKYTIDDRDIERHDNNLVKVIEELGDAASGRCAKLKIVEIPDGTDYEISEYDGNEHIAEKHNTWY